MQHSTRDAIRLVSSGALIVLLILFVVLNTERVSVNLIVKIVEVPLIFVLLGTALVGAAAALLARFTFRRRTHLD